jgi:hypothetical protein
MPPEPQNTPKLSPPVFIWILIIVAALIGSIEIWQALLQKVSVQNQPLKSSDWKIYKNESRHFQISYPATMKAREIYAHNIVVCFEDEEQTLINGLAVCIDDNTFPSAVSTLNSIIINDSDFKQTSGKYSDGSYVIYSENVQLLKNIVSTFKFTTEKTTTLFELNTNFNIDVPQGWSIRPTSTSNYLSEGLVRGKLLGNYQILLPEKFNGPHTSFWTGVYVFSDDKFAGYNYDNGWVYYDTDDKSWFATGIQNIDGAGLSFNKNKNVLLKSKETTYAKLPIYSDFGYGDAGCGDEHSLVHIIDKGIILDFNYGSCYTGSMIDDSDGIKADAIFKEFRNKWPEMIKTLKIL